MPVRCGTHILPLFSCLLVATVGAAHAQDSVIPPDKHAWAKFDPGSTKKVRITTSSNPEDSSEISSHVALVDTVLQRVSDTGFTLRSQITTVVNGQSYPNPPQLLEPAFNGADDGAYRKLRDEVLEVDGIKFATEVLELVYENELEKRVTQIWFQPDHEPFVLKKQVLETNKLTDEVLYRMDAVVTSVNHPIEVLNVPQIGWTVRVEQFQGDRKTTITEVHCGDVPGSLVSHNLVVMDKDEKVVRHSKLELMDYEISTSGRQARRGVGDRIREHIQRKRARRSGGDDLPETVEIVADTDANVTS